MGNLNKISVGEKVEIRLRQMKGRTGLTPNILCRLGFCLSLEAPGIPDPTLYDSGAREFNRYTLTGQWDALFFGLLRERLVQDKLDIKKDLEEQFTAHLSRGILLLYSRMKNIEDLDGLITEAMVKAGFQSENLNEVE